MSNKNKSNYTPFSIYQKRKMAEEGTPLKSIYAKNHNMFSKGVGHLRAGLDSGFEQAEAAGKKRKKPPGITPSQQSENEKTENKVNKLSESDNETISNAADAIMKSFKG
jgi:hypothetical protein